MTRVALIGAGRWGSNILRTLQAIPNCDVVAIATTAQETAALSTQELDGVLIATPGSTHAKIALPFVKRGIPTFIEKPMTLTVRDAERIVDMAKKTKTPVLVGHIHLYNPAYQALKRELKHIGTITTIVGESMSSGPVREDMTVLWDWGPHDVAMVLDILRTTPRRVRAVGTGMHTQAHLTFTVNKKAVEVFLTTSWLSPEKRKRLIVVGTDGMVVFDDYAAKKVTRTKHGRVAHPRYSKQSPLDIEIREFIKMIRKDTGAVQSETALDVIRVLAAIESEL